MQPVLVSIWWNPASLSVTKNECTNRGRGYRSAWYPKANARMRHLLCFPSGIITLCVVVWGVTPFTTDIVREGSFSSEHLEIQPIYINWTSYMEWENIKCTEGFCYVSATHALKTDCLLKCLKEWTEFKISFGCYRWSTDALILTFTNWVGAYGVTANLTIWIVLNSQQRWYPLVKISVA